MQQPESNTNIGLKYGLIAGLIITLVVLLQYLGGLEMFMSPIQYVSYLVVITMAVLAALKVRRSNENFLEFSQALKITFTVFAVSLFIQTVFVFILMNYIDTDFRDAAAQEALNQGEQMLRKMGMSDADIDTQMEAARGKNQFSALSVLMGYALSCIVSFIFCLLISLIVKKSKPQFHNI